ncbi:cysteine proteinase [Hypoxylon sp. FL1284]|nr:cysteine proteinase [Hypoxylon sp. FL1284]
MRVAKKAAERPGEATSRNPQTMYEEAAAACKAEVARIAAECRRQGIRYSDWDFDLEIDLARKRFDTLEFLDFDQDNDDKPRVWDRVCPGCARRVTDIFPNPKLLAALCSVSTAPCLIEKVCVARDEPVGVYGFVFYRDCEYIWEIIDDKLFLDVPDFDERFSGRIEGFYRQRYQHHPEALFFASCADPNETWLPLLEKAFAKAHGDYSSISGGTIGAGLEDLTGGVSLQFHTADILDKDRFWKEELMKAGNELFFGCYTMAWTRELPTWRRDSGIEQSHAYSIMRAVEIDGQRLVKLKNPWGGGQGQGLGWKGAWSDGSKEWTEEWKLKLDHTSRDDGSFWMSFDDLLHAFHVVDKARLFGPEWRVTSLWTTVPVPWESYSRHVYFTFSLAKAGPVVIALSQLDSSYWRGFEGSYVFQLNFHLYKRGQKDYVVRSSNQFTQIRSTSVEVELEEGEYMVLLKVTADYLTGRRSAKDLTRLGNKYRRGKLHAVHRSCEFAHSKGRVTETLELWQAPNQKDKCKEKRKRQELKDRLMQVRRDSVLWQVNQKAKLTQRQGRQQRRERQGRRPVRRLRHTPNAKDDEGRRATPKVGEDNDDGDKNQEKPKSSRASGSTAAPRTPR